MFAIGFTVAARLCIARWTLVQRFHKTDHMRTELRSSSFRGAEAKRRRTRNPVTTDRDYWIPGSSTIGLRPTVSPRNDETHDANLEIAELNASREGDKLADRQEGPMSPGRR